MTDTDQSTWQRLARTGGTHHDAARACQGYVLFSPLNETKATLVIDMAGEIVHRWDHDCLPGHFGYLMENGNLHFNGKADDGNADLWPRWAQLNGGLMREVDWDGNVLWEHRDPFHHHDARRTAAGGAIYLSLERVPEEMRTRIRGGYEPDDGLGMWADKIVEIDQGGEVVWEWRAIEHFDPESEVIAPMVPRWEWTHCNTVFPIGDDRVLVSMRHTSTVVIIEKATGKIVWRLGDDVLSGQHDSQILANGNILIFDNGAHRKTGGIVPYSWVIEVDPATDEIVWSYQDNPPQYFYSFNISGVGRLPNGNTMICEGARGRLFQVTPDGEVVWEYVSPYFAPDATGTLTNNVFRAFFYETLPQK